MISLWNMVKGRVIAAVVSAVVTGLALLGVDVAADTEIINAVTALIGALFTLIQLVAYAVFHNWSTKQKLVKGEVAEENIQSLRTPAK